MAFFQVKKIYREQEKEREDRQEVNFNGNTLWALALFKGWLRLVEVQWVLPGVRV